MTPDKRSSLAVIPARGGSKRLPRKNILDFMGRPIMAYTIRAAVESGCFGRVLVSTEDEEIARVAERFGAEVAARPEALAGDKAGVVAVCLDLLDREKQAGNDYEFLCCLYATAPLRTAKDIREVFGLLGPNCDFAMAVTEYEMPPLQALKVAADGSLEPMWPDWISVRSQDTPRLVVDNGSTYAVRVEAFRHAKSFYGPGLRGHFMPRSRSVDIDTAEDMALARHFAEQEAKP